MGIPMGWGWQKGQDGMTICVLMVMGMGTE